MISCDNVVVTGSDDNDACLKGSAMALKEQKK